MYVGINESLADVAGTSAAALTALQDRVRDNSEHTARSRLKRGGLTYVPGLSSGDTATDVVFSDFTGPLDALLEYDNGGNPVTGSDPRSIGAWIATPPMRPLCIATRWPVSANAASVRIVLCSRVVTAGAMQVLAHVWDGEGWYPTPPGSATLEPLEVSGYESSTTFQFRADLRSLSCFRELTASNVSNEGVRWDALTVPMPSRTRIDRTIQRDGDRNATGLVVLSFLSVRSSVTVEDTTTLVNADDPRQPVIALRSHEMPQACRDGAAPLLGLVTGSDGALRWHLMPAVRSNGGHPNYVHVACWPPLAPPERANGTSIDLVYAPTLNLSSIGISEIGDA